MNQQPVNLNGILSAAQKRAELLLEKTGGQILIKHPLPTVRGNPTLLAQLFSNLIENAVKYRRSEPPLICVDAASDQRYHTVTFSDNGRGVPEEDRERVFMSRERGSNVGDTPGSGLGLALCRRIMQAHGGTISAGTSESGGAAFELLFPCSAHPLEKRDEAVTTSEEILSLSATD
jgi:signal transduction histidine kinase